MIKTITLLVYLSSTLRHVVSYPHRLSEEQLDSFATDKAFAQSYAMQLCQSVANFWVNGESFESAFGPLGYSKTITTENTHHHLDGGKPIVGYSNMKADSYLTRNISEFTMPNCTEIVHSDDSSFLERKIFLKMTTESSLRVNVTWPWNVTRKASFRMRWFFQSDGTCKKLEVTTLTGHKILDFFNKAKHGAQAALSVAQYLGVIDEEVEGSQRNIQYLTKLVFIIVALFCVVIAGVIAYGVNLCLQRYDQQRVKYNAVPQIAVDSQ